MGAAASAETKADGDQTSLNAQLLPKAARPSALVVCGPSGVGKGTLIKELMSSSDKFGFSCSHTTRSPRPGEENGKEYYFTSHQDFERGIAAGEFLEYAHVHNNIYGTSLRAVEDVAASGRCCVLDIDVQGSRKVRASKLRAVFVFIAPPSLEELEKRLRGRGTETEEQMQRRLATAKQEVQSTRETGLFDYVIVNDNVTDASKRLAAVAQRALAGQVGNDGADGPVELTATGDKKPEKVGVQEGAPAATQAARQPSEEAPGPSSGKGQAAEQVSDSGGQQAAAPASPVRKQLKGIARWRGRVALVTGASAGIGWATCERLALEGLRVVAVARRRERLEALQQHLVAAGVPIADFLPVVCDITKEAEVVALPRIIVKRWPGSGIDILVNNAGLGRNNAALFDGKTSSWVEMISTNVLGPCMCTREALLDMKRRQQWGHVINVSSMSGHRVPDAAGSGGAFYSATKHALRALTEGLRQEARGKQVPLRVSQISPGVVETEFDVVQNFGDQAAAQQRYQSMSCLQPENVADAIVWAIAAPENVDVHDVLMRPVGQKL